MNGEPAVELQRWAEAYAALEPGESEWSFEEHRRAWERWLRLLADRSSSVVLTERQWDSLAARLAEDVGDILWESDGESLDFRLTLLDSVAPLAVMLVSKTPTEHDATDMFWDRIAITARAFDVAALPGIARKSEPPPSDVFEKLFEVLSNQLRMRDRQLQLCALRGLKQLGHPRTQAILDAMQDVFADDEVRWAADRTSRSELI